MKNIVKITAVAAIAFTATGVFAAPHPKPHNHHKETNGIRLAADIIDLVNSTVNLLTGTPNTVVINQTPAVVTQPAVIVNTPCPPQQTVIVNNPPPPPPPKTVIINNNRPRQNNTVIINNNKPHRPKPQPVQHHYGRPTVKNVKHNFADLPQHRRR